MHEQYAPPQSAPQGWYAAPAPFPPVPSRGRGLAIASLALSAFALLGVIAVAVLVLVRTGTNDAGPAGSGGPLTGQLAASTSGGPIAGAQLSRAVSTRIDQDGGDVTLMNCPDTAKVGQGVVTVCHGVVSSSEYAIVVYFEDKAAASRSARSDGPAN
jgi:hypothetical protein